MKTNLIVSNRPTVMDRYIKRKETKDQRVRLNDPVVNRQKVDKFQKKIQDKQMKYYEFSEADKYLCSNPDIEDD